MNNKYKIILTISLLIVILTVPIWRWNLLNKSHYSILEALLNKDIDIMELIVGNIYNLFII